MELIRGVELLQHEVFRDEGGELVVFEQFNGLPFAAKRVFFISVSSPDAVRGGHANSCHELLVAVSGSVIVEVDNGAQSADICLDTRDKALWIRPGVLIRLRRFVPHAIVLAFASARYDETRHFDRPQPHLIAAEDAT
jgi:dTDP-4-dehydrorhamnose 3,5-epimerase-like enzyme